jgi:hypothetical protein
MKSLLKVVGTSGLLILLFAMPAGAQIQNGLEFSTKFPFYAGNTKLPAGTYKITASGQGDTILLIRDASESHSAYIEFTPTQAEGGHKASDVTFHRYGTVEYLNQVWVQGQTYGMQIDPTKVEQKLAAATPPETHSVSAKAK